MHTPTFTEDKDNKQVVMERLFDVPKQQVWDAFTKEDILVTWWGPTDWPATSKSMDFREGGHWHYVLNGPDGNQSWGWTDFVGVDTPHSYTAIDSFSDPQGNKNTDIPSSRFRNEFRDLGNGTTKLTTTITFNSVEDMKQMLEMGFKEGFTDSLQNLERVLTA